MVLKSTRFSSWKKWNKPIFYAKKIKLCITKSRLESFTVWPGSNK